MLLSLVRPALVGGFWGCLALSTNTVFAADAVFSSPRYRYSISVPDGWVQVPDAEIARSVSENLPPQAQHLIYDAGFQRGNVGQWFELPYLLIQIIPSERLGIRRLPTVAEFEKFASAMTGKKTLSQIGSIVDSVKDPNDKADLKAFLASLSSQTVQVDTKRRKYWFTVEAPDSNSDAVKTLVAGFFLADGNLVQINCSMAASSFDIDVGHFAAIVNSFQSKAVATSTATTPKVRATRN